MEKKKFNYGYIVVAACMAVLATTLGIAQNCTSIFIPHLANGLDIPRTSAQLVFTFFSIGSIIASLIATKVYEKNRPYKIMRIMCLFVGPIYFLNSFATGIIQHYLIAFMVGLTSTFITMLPITLLVTDWFKENKGKVLGITLMGSTLGGAIFSPIAGKCITQFGYSKAYAILGIVMMAVSIPCVLFVIRDAGNDVEKKDDENVVKDSDAKQEDGHSITELKKQPLFWLFLFSLTLSSIAGINANTTISPHLVELGYSVEKAASFSSLAMLSMTAGKFILGAIFDRFGASKALIIAQAFLCLSLFGLLMSNVPAFIYVAVAAVGLGGVLVTVGYPLIVQTAFGNRSYSSIFGLVNAFSMAGNMLASIVTGISFDTTGSYNASFIFLISLTVISTIIILVTIKKYEQKR